MDFPTRFETSMSNGLSTETGDMDKMGILTNWT